MDDKLYLGELMVKNKHKYENNNFILSPVGSGKTHFIFNDLSKKYKGRKLMLVSTTSLKDSLKIKNGVFTTKDMNDRKEKLNIKDENIHIMTYSEFGKVVAWKEGHLENYVAVFCDEIHSLFDYFSFTKSYMLAAAIRTLFIESKTINTKIFYFTATIDKIRKFINNEKFEVLNGINIINYLGHKEIVSHDNATLVEFTDVREILDVIDSLDGFRRMGYKGVIFNDRINGMKEIQELLRDKGYNALTIWSVNNKNNPMSQEQLSAREELLRTGEIPAGYDFLIINGSMREGWNLVDEKVELVILNTDDETSRTQARGRVRKDVFLLAGRVYDKHVPLEMKIIRREKSKRAVGKRLGIPLTSKDKESITDELGVVNEYNRLVKWPTIKKAMKKEGYEIEDKSIMMDGELTRVTIVIDPKISD